MQQGQQLIDGLAVVRLIKQGLMLARGIPDARFVALESKNHLILSHEPAWGRFIDEICGFLREDEPQRLTAAV